jgi:hypothetical protein
MKRTIALSLVLIFSCSTSIGYAEVWPSGATAKCKDGTYSYAKNHRGMCSKHHGVVMFK